MLLFSVLHTESDTVLLDGIMHEENVVNGINKN